MADTIKIGGELESMATGGIVAATSAIKDKAKDKYQSEINQEVDQALADRYTKNEAYNKQQTDAQIEKHIVNVVTREKYKTFLATAEDVSIDTILPPAGYEDTIYRVAKWNGTEYNTSYWTEYAWTQDDETTGHYEPLAVKNQGLDTTPTPNSLNPVSSGGVADACGHLEECPEYMKVETDAEGKIMHSVNVEDGAYWFHKLKSPTLDGMKKSTEELSDYVKEDHPFTNKKISILGDSISTFDQEGYKIDGYPMWYPHQDDRSSDVVSVDDTWWKKVINNTNGIFEVNASYSGSTASTIVAGFSSRVPLLGNPDVIFIALGTNDSGRNVEIGKIDFNSNTYDLTKFAPAYVKGIKDTVSLYPNSMIVCVIFDMGEDYKDVIKNVAEHYNLPCIDVSGVSVIHPNKAEMQAVYEKIYSDTNKLSVWVNEKINASIRQNERDLAAHYDYYNVSKHHSVRDVVDVYTANDGWEQVEYDSSLAPYDELDIYQIGEKCNFGGDTEYSYEATISQRGVAPATITQEYSTRTKFTLEEALAVLPAAVISAFAAGQKICFVDLDDFVEEWQITEAGIWERISPYDVKDPEDRIEIKLDAEGKIVAYRKADGTWVECVGIEAPNLGDFVDREEGKSLINSDYAEAVDVIDDPEGILHLDVDAENKIVSERDKDGRLHEYVGVETNSLTLTNEGMNEFQQALKDAGFQPGGGGDWSDKTVVEIPEPKSYAILNLKIGGLPVGSVVKEGYAEYYDKMGNFFKKAVKVDVQGQSSANFANTGGRGNYTLDIDDGSEIKFGSWVPQDSFHLKGTPKDVTHGILATSYKWAYMFMEHLNAKPNRVLLKGSSEITTTNASGDRFTDWIDDARCLPDGFPVEIYVDGEYWGLYAWQLKKHRKNYSIKKSDYTSLFIDADNLLDSDYQHGFWLDGVDSAPAGTTGKTWWNYFDIKGPKDLVCMDGSAFDGDNPKELIDNTSPVYDSSNKKHKGSAQAKAIIRGFSTKYLEVKELIDNNNIEGAKAKFNENFDYNACMLVYIFNCLMKNGDSIKKNTLWGTWKDGKIAPMLWDIDGVYGTDWWGGTCGAPGAGMWDGGYATSAWPLSFMWTLYQDEIKATYAELRSHGIIDMNTWRSIVLGWAKQIGTEAFDRDIEKWPEMPSYRENYTNTEYWQQYGSSSAYSTYPTWDENTSYSVGDIVVIKIHPSVNWYLRYRAVQSSDAQNPQPPVTKLYDACPQVGGYYDSPRRMEKWMEEQIRLCDIVMEYNQ